ncbi:hypothetical protein [Mesorhizobium sp. IMUNJ 23232]|uniref:hypothetical protein n=1 Tax=Mesorhizobium sp. IMUNJ 23232 TaxID=3376064 RepID=UPI003795DD1B
MATIIGTIGNDVLSLTNGSDVVTALDGVDKIMAGAFFNATDKVDGGAKQDTVVLDGDYSAQLTLAADTLLNVEVLELRTGHDYSIKTHEATVGANAELKVVFAGDTALGGRLIFDGSAETSGRFDLFGGAGNDILKGGASGDGFSLGGGTDTILGNGGDDVVNAAGNLTATDKINGGDGYDLLKLDGDYQQQLIFGASSLKQVEYIHLRAGHTYSLKTDDANVAAGQQLSIDVIDGTSGRILFDGSGEKDGHFGVKGTDGDDIIKGGGSDDVFWVWQEGLDKIVGGGGDDTAIFNDGYSPDDRFAGGTGHDTIVVGGDMELTLDAEKISSVEQVTLDKKDFGSTLLTVCDSFVAKDTTLTVDFNWGGGFEQALGFNGSDETDGRFDLSSGEGNDILFGGAGDDVFHMNRGGNDFVSAGAGNDKIEFEKDFDKDDSVDGGDGYDALHVSAHAAMGTLTNANLKGIEALYFTYSAPISSATIDDSIAPSGGTLDVSAGYLTAGTHFTFDASAETDAAIGYMDHVGTDIVYGGGGDEDVDLRGGGTDKVYAGDGDDLIRASNTLDATDRLNGGKGEDRVSLDGEYLFAFESATMRNVEFLSLASGHDYELYLHKDTIGAGQTLTVGGYWLDAGDKLVISDTSGGTGTLDVRAGLAFLNSGSAVRAGTGTEDKVDLDGDYSAPLVFNAGTLLGVEHLTLGAGHSYNLVSHDNTVAAGKSMEVRGYWLGAADKLTFDGSAETNGSFQISGGAGDDVLTVGAGADDIRLDMGGHDVAFGGKGDDVFDLGAALDTADQINGGSGYDTLRLNGDVVATLGTTTVSDIEKIQLWSGHTYLFGINDGLLDAGETLTLTAWSLGADDIVKFSGQAETNGSFLIETGAAIDTLQGGQAADVLKSGAGNDKLFGHGGSDTLNGGIGSDTLNGGDGFDIASYETSQGAVTACLASGKGTGGDAQGDTFTSIEGLRGSVKHDLLSGGASSDTLDGYNGDDLLQGGAGADTLVGGYGTDTATYTASAIGVTINLGTGLASGGEAAGDIFFGIENITGSAFNDVISGDNGRNVLLGGKGADILAGMEHGDTLDGGEGNDILVGGINSDTFVFSGPDWGTDTILDYETGYDELDLRGHGFEFQDLKLIYANGNATVVTTHGSIVLAGVSSGLSADDFLL